jgi:nicotinamidase-related amidase
MTLTTLDPITALIVVDLQNAIGAYPAVRPAAEIAEAAGRLAAAFREHDLPVVLVTVAGGAPGRTETPRRASGGEPPANAMEVMPELDRQPSDITVTKVTWGVFASTDLDTRLKALGVTQVVVAGIATTAGVESTARQAFELGYNVTLATDAMTDSSAEAHENSVTRIFPRLGETGTVAEIVALLDAE